MKLHLYNTLTKKVEEFKPLEIGKVKLYACGPTVYDYAHIGNFRTYVMTDLLVRMLKYFDYEVRYVMNITDVGHLTSDSDTGQDKLEKGAAREGKSAWDIAKFYTKVFLADGRKLNLLEPDVRPRPTQEKYLKAQIAFIQELEDKGFTYKTRDGIYFDTSKFPSYGALTAQDRKDMQEGARVEKNPEKRNPTDFALWKFSSSPETDDQGKDIPRRQMEWFFKGPHSTELFSERKWMQMKKNPDYKNEWFDTLGFPGWHIECSAMSRVELGDRIDIHTGATDLIPIHHTNEIAQSEAATEKVPFSAFWIHGQFITVDGAKMSKSAENFYHLSDLEKRQIDPLSLRYLYLTAHYRQFLNFSWEALSNAQQSLERLRKHVASIKETSSERNSLSKEKLESLDAFRNTFNTALANDLNMPQALAVVWEVVKSNIPSPDKLDLLYSFDEVLGLDLQHASGSRDVEDIPDEVQNLVSEREDLRKSGDWQKADEMRKEIEELGYSIVDLDSKSVIKKND